MSKCLLTGHTPIQREGVGDYAGKQYLVCSECAMTLTEIMVTESEHEGGGKTTRIAMDRHDWIVDRTKLASAEHIPIEFFGGF